MTGSSGISVLRIAVGVSVGLVLVWYLLPGLFDPRSKSLLGSENRRSPLAGLAGPKTVIDKTISLNEDHYGGYGFELTVGSKVSITVTQTSGPEFEVYVVDKSGYAEFDAAAGQIFGGQFHHFPDLAGVVGPTNLIHRKSAGLASGEYMVLLENTDFGKTSPPANFNDDIVEARVQVVVQ